MNRNKNEAESFAGNFVASGEEGQLFEVPMRLFEDHNSVWNEWVDPANPPARACLTTDFWRPGMLVEVMVVAALP